MNWEILFCLLSAHLFCDFVVQSKKILNLRYSSNFHKRIKGNLLHACIHYLVSTLIIIGFYSFSPALFIILILYSFLHGLTDYLKADLIVRKAKFKNSLSLFLGDQLVHVAVIFLFSLKIGAFSSDDLLTVLLRHFGSTGFLASFASITYGQKLMLAVAIVIAALWGVGVFIRMFLSGVKGRSDIDKNIGNHMESLAYNRSTPDGGFIIGIMERFFIICSIALNMTQIIGFLLATKSIARFKKFDDDRFVETFIIGSFISFSCAIVAGVIIKALNIIPAI